MSRHGRSRNLFEDFYPSAAEDEDYEETLDETIRQGVISSRMPIGQAPSDRDVGEDASEGWERTADDPLIAPFTGEAKLLADINPDADPVDFFNLFMDDAMFDLLVEQTNLYADRKRESGEPSPHSRLSRWSPVSRDEMKTFFALVILTGVVVKSSIPAYWSTDEVDATPFFGQTMSLTRFQGILSNLHLADNTLDDKSDPLFKIRPFVNHLRLQFVDVYSPRQDLSFDEGMCPWKGHLRFRVYNPAKPTKFGVKLYEVCEADSGYIVGFDVYQGSSPCTTYAEAVGVGEECTQTTKIVTGLLAYCGLLSKGHHVYMDNYYTSPELFEELDVLNTYACGTVRVARKGMPEALQKKAIKLRQGETIFRQRKNLLALKHHDKRDVHMLTTIHTADEVILDKHDAQGQLVVKPTCIVDYIQKMGGVDLADQMCKNYTVIRKTVKWWKKLFMHLLTLAMCNAYILHRKFANAKMSHVDFRKELVRGLIRQATSAPRPAPKGKRKANPPTRLQASHTPVYIPAKEGAKRKRPLRDCVACNIKKSQRKGYKRKQTSYMCDICQVPLCVPDCFEAYHKKVHYKRTLQPDEPTPSTSAAQ